MVGDPEPYACSEALVADAQNALEAKKNGLITQRSFVD
jgi:hypothetical protein